MSINLPVDVYITMCTLTLSSAMADKENITNKLLLTKHSVTAPVRISIGAVQNPAPPHKIYRVCVYDQIKRKTVHS